MLLTVCKIKRVDESPALQQLQFTQKDGELRSKRENYQPYGFAHYPHPESEGISLSQNGDREHIIVVCVTDRNHRFKLKEEGEVALYDDQGQFVFIHRNKIEIWSDKEVHIHSGGNINLHAEDTVNITAGNRIHLHAPEVTTDG